MKNGAEDQTQSPENTGQRSPLRWFLVAGCLLIVLIGALFSAKNKTPSADSPSSNNTLVSNSDADTSAHRPPIPRRSNPQAILEPALTASEIVSNKVARFAASRRKLAHAMADRFKTTLPPEFEQLFDAAEAGRFDDMEALYKALRKQREDGTDKSWYGPQWRTIVETVGVAEAAHDWPAQRLLDYGNAILGALRPGMVYVGGTDPGCFIPRLLNETSEGERHIVLTQNALADGIYLENLDFLYGDQMKTLTKEQSQQAFQEYLADAQKRFRHDQQFPNDPKQLKTREDIRI